MVKSAVSFKWVTSALKPNCKTVNASAQKRTNFGQTSPKKHQVQKISASAFKRTKWSQNLSKTLSANDCLPKKQVHPHARSF